MPYLQVGAAVGSYRRTSFGKMEGDRPQGLIALYGWIKPSWLRGLRCLPPLTLPKQVQGVRQGGPLTD